LISQDKRIWPADRSGFAGFMVTDPVEVNGRTILRAAAPQPPGCRIAGSGGGR
jgi:hypothetical protein